MAFMRNITITYCNTIKFIAYPSAQSYYGCPKEISSEEERVIKLMDVREYQQRHDRD